MLGAAGGAGAAGEGGVAAEGAVKTGGTIGVPILAAGAGVVATGRRGATAACKPASVSTIGDIGADSQSSPNSTLPRVIANTAP